MSRLIFALLLFLALPLRAAEAPLVLAFDELYPWKTHEDGKYGGAYTEIVRELARRLHLALEVKHCPLRRCLYMLERGEADLTIGMRSDPTRARYLAFLATPYRKHASDRVFYVNRQDGPAIANYADLPGLRIGVKDGANYFSRFDQDPAMQKDGSRDAETSLRKLLLHRIDAVILPEDQGEALLTRLNLRLSIVKASYRVPDASARSIGVARHSVHMPRLAEFDKAMADMVRDGTLEAIYKRHYYEALNVPADSVQIR
ncbi:MAG: transporter substrate-binding domain-containing protein [Pseudomonadota bacterium]